MIWIRYFIALNWVDRKMEFESFAGGKKARKGGEKSKSEKDEEDDDT